MNDRVRVSIVTPFLDAGSFLEEAIESVRAQTFQEWELLLVDDGSSDGSTAIAQRYAAALPGKIHYLAHADRENRGASASRNLGIRHAVGEYLAFLDADDVYLPDKVKAQVRILDRVKDAQVLYAATEYWHSWAGTSNTPRDWIWHPHGVDIGKVIQPPQALVSFLADGGTVPCMGSMLARRGAVVAAGGWEDSFRTICTDQVFHAKLTLQLPVIFVDECWDRYRQHAASSCHRVAAAGQTETTFLTYLRWLEQYLTDRRATDTAVWSALRKALRSYEPAPAATVVIPCFNQSRFLGDAIESALRQTVRPIEVIVVDDGSTDDTPSVAARYDGVTYLRQRNGGAPSARNHGFRQSRGEFVVFLDADDRLLPDAVALGIAALRDRPEWAFVTGHVQLIDAAGTSVGTPAQDHAAGDQFTALLRSNYIWTPGAVVYRRASLDTSGPFDASARASADYELNLRLARQHAAGCHHHVVLEYRRHGGNMSGDVGEMLRSAVSVRLRQRRYVGRNEAALRAWKEGLEIVRADYGERLIDQVKRDVRSGEVARAVRGLACLSRYYPAGLLRTLTAGVRSPASA